MIRYIGTQKRQATIQDRRGTHAIRVIVSINNNTFAVRDSSMNQACCQRDSGKLIWVTQLGQLMDPLADKLLITAALVSLVQMGMASAWMVALILGRELAITVLRSVAYVRGVTIPASRLGKVKMGTQVFAILLLILGRQVWLFWIVGQIALWVVLTTALWSAVDYYRRFSHVVSHPNVTEFESARQRAEQERNRAKAG